MRKLKEHYSKKALAVLAMADKLSINAHGNPRWSLVEATDIETPIGEVHLHWFNHRGKGNWRIVTNPQWRGEICGTVRCRRVVITPLGGENESVPTFGNKTLSQLSNEWLWTRPGAVCSWPKEKYYSIEQNKFIEHKGEPMVYTYE